MWFHLSMKLYRPSLDQLPAIARAWEKVLATSPHPFRQQQLDQIVSDPEGYLRSLDGEVDGVLLRLEDGSEVAKLPMITRYMWVNDEPAGSISYRWQEGGTKLPPHVLGHIGYETFPWHQRKGYATAALREMLEFPRQAGMPFVEIVTNLSNGASQKVVINNGGVFIEEFEKPSTSGGGRAYLFRINL